jgi:hypothetical protein
MTIDAEPQTAMLLTEEEWDDLAEICKHFRSEFPTPTSLGLSHSPGGEERWVVTDRRRDIAKRIIDACD